MKKKKSIVLLILIIGLIGILISIYGFTYAKYTANSILDYYLKSKGFYFYSDDLGINGVNNVNNFWTGENVNFNIRNNLNEIVVTDYDVNYKVTCTIKGDLASTSNCYINNTDSNIYEGVLSDFQICTNSTNDGVNVSSLDKEECEIGGYNWKNQKAVQNLYFNVVSESNIMDVTVNIKVESTNPYKKTLSGDFILHKMANANGSISLDYKNYSTYDRLIVSNSHLEDKCTTIVWDSSNLRISVDSSKLISYETDMNGYINKIKVRIPRKDSVSYIFYKKNINDIFNVNDFSFQEDESC